MTQGTEPVSETAPTVLTRVVTSSPELPSSGMERKGPGLGFQFFVAAALLVLVVLGTAVFFATVRADQIAEKTIREALQQVPAVFQNYMSNIESEQTKTLHNLAGDAGTKALADTAPGDSTVWQWAVDHAPVLHARTVFVFDQAGVLIARSDLPFEQQKRQDFSGVKWVAEPLRMNEITATIREKSVLATVAAVPIIAGEMERGEARIRGVLAVSFPLDDSHAAVIHGITGGQVGLVANTAKRGEDPRMELSGATPGFGKDSLAALAEKPDAVKTLFVNGSAIGPLDLTVAGDRRIVGALPIKNLSGETLGAFVVSRSRAEETAAFRQIRNTLLFIGLLAVLVSIPISFAMGRRIARPLEQLAKGAEAIRHGSLDVPLPEAGSDEVGALARAFRAMVGELREKAQLEQMIAEMRRVPDAPTGRTLTIAPGAPEPGAVSEGPQVGKVFAGRYKIQSILGKGGMGAVYLALDRELDEEVALKVLTPEAFDESTQAVQTIKQEIRLARKITHPNVVRTHDLGESDGTRFLTMEYVPGTMLKEVLDRKGALAIAPGLQIAKQLCRGLGAVHEAGIIHRDIKPHNVMVLPNGVVKLMDFGIARATEGVDLNAEKGQTVGTPYYMSPEQARGENLDPRSDIYSVGVVLYECFTGERPFEGSEPVEVMRKHIAIEPRRPALLRTALPELLDRIIMACLSKNPDRRPPGANDLYNALMRVAVKSEPMGTTARMV